MTAKVEIQIFVDGRREDRYDVNGVPFIIHPTPRDVQNNTSIYVECGINTISMKMDTGKCMGQGTEEKIVPRFTLGMTQSATDEKGGLYCSVFHHTIMTIPISIVITETGRNFYIELVFRGLTQKYTIPKVERPTQKYTTTDMGDMLYDNNQDGN